MGNGLHKREIAFAAVVGGLALLSILAMSALVAKPKLLFGRSLSAIDPTLFPRLALWFVVVLSLAIIWISWRLIRDRPDVQSHSDEADQSYDWVKVAAFFGILVLYALMFKPFGFLISSFTAISAAALLMGNRNWLQILALALICPIGLYLISTRGLLVSLPELDIIELTYSRLLG